MSQYILILLWIALLFPISHLIQVRESQPVPGVSLPRYHIWFVLVAVAPLIWWTATRPQWFGDTYAYIKAFQALPTQWGQLFAYLPTVTKDKGFSLLSGSIKILFRSSPTAYLLILGAVQALLVALVYRKYSCDFLMSLFLFVATTDYLSWMHNGIRQFTAVVLIFAATGLMLKKKYLPLLAVILLASTIHGSALLMIPVVLVVQGKPWNKRTLLAIVALILALAFVDGFTDLLDELLEDTQYTNVVSDWRLDGDDGTNPLRVLVYSIPTILSLIGFRYIRAANDPVINLACNMGIISTLLYLLSMVTSGIFIGRLPIYCSLYATGILLPWELEHMFTKESAKLLKALMAVLFIMFYYYQVHFTWGLI